RRCDKGRRPDPRARSRQDRGARHARRADRERRRVQRPLPHADRYRIRHPGGGLMAVATPRRSGLEAEAVLRKAYAVRLMRRLATYIRPHVALLGAWVVFMLLGIGLELAQPMVVIYALEHHILRKPPNIDALPFDALLYIGLVIGQGIAGFFDQWFLQLAGQ